jgi:hypothetical protein
MNSYTEWADARATLRRAQRKYLITSLSIATLPGCVLLWHLATGLHALSYTLAAVFAR